MPNELSREQYDILLRPLNKNRVHERSQAGRTFSYLEAYEVKAHLIRIFGFGGFSAQVLSCDLTFEEKDDKGRWHVGYRTILRLHIPTLDATYTEASVGTATLPQRGEAHDMACKTSESDALKRAATYLGDQFGLSLYKNGSLDPLIISTLRPVRETVTEEADDDGAE